jgi:SPP1 gp7 family putative phage head morphogenesis protein
VEDTVWREFVNQTPRNDIAKMLQEQLDIGKSRAELIARDQTVKLSGELNRLRQQQAGIDQYTWRHSGKVNFRPEHKARDGKVFDWNDPPADGHPGNAINCGCTAQAYIDLSEDDDVE